MKQSILALAVRKAFGKVYKGVRTHDISFGFRMGAGFPGDVNRVHPFSIVAGLVDTAIQSPRLYGDPVLINTATNAYRGITTTDTSTLNVDGVAVRPYPTQQQTGGMTSTLGVAAPPTNLPLDVLEDGFIMATCHNLSGSTTLPTKKGAVYVYTAASSGNHVQGGLESASGANLTLISNMVWWGPADANGIAELRVLALAS